MDHYMVKTFKDNGRLLGRFEFIAPSDEEAEGAAIDLDADESHELWCGRRWIRSWPARISAGLGAAGLKAAAARHELLGCNNLTLEARP